MQRWGVLFYNRIQMEHILLFSHPTWDALQQRAGCSRFKSGQLSAISHQLSAVNGIMRIAGGRPSESIAIEEEIENGSDN